MFLDLSVNTRLDHQAGHLNTCLEFFTLPLELLPKRHLNLSLGIKIVQNTQDKVV